MEKAKFTIALTASRRLALRGRSPPPASTQLEFIAQTNPGQRPTAAQDRFRRRTLAHHAGAQGHPRPERSRISVLVFDEIDANVGGRLGSIIGSKLRKLAAHHQVLCITHLPQIASYADRHLTVRKESDGRQTRTTVRAMEGDERLGELSEMIGGQRVTETTRAQARELLQSAQSEFAKPAATARVSRATMRKNLARNDKMGSFRQRKT